MKCSSIASKRPHWNWMCTVSISQHLNVVVDIVYIFTMWLALSRPQSTHKHINHPSNREILLPMDIWRAIVSSLSTTLIVLIYYIRFIRWWWLYAKHIHSIPFHIHLYFIHHRPYIRCMATLDTFCNMSVLGESVMACSSVAWNVYVMRLIWLGILSVVPIIRLTLGSNLNPDDIEEGRFMAMTNWLVSGGGSDGSERGEGFQEDWLMEKVTCSGLLKENAKAIRTNRSEIGCNLFWLWMCKHSIWITECQGKMSTVYILEFTINVSHATTSRFARCLRTTLMQSCGERPKTKICFFSPVCFSVPTLHWIHCCCAGFVTVLNFLQAMMFTGNVKVR